ncbi:MAG: hypothetical protein RBS96_08635, partial [Dehalococcoidales bacterium]|nr:hypothetical protein [Dehalococcoidales bacterium]
GSLIPRHTRFTRFQCPPNRHCIIIEIATSYCVTLAMTSDAPPNRHCESAPALVAVSYLATLIYQPTKQAWQSQILDKHNPYV